MLSFDTSLSNALAIKNTTTFWVLKLYHSDEGTSDFLGVSDFHRVDGSDIYHGLVSSWGTLQQSLDFFKFNATVGSMTVTLINTDRSVDGGRFSDLFASNNYANRKWELFQNTAQAGTYDTAARMIGSGIIGGDLKHDTGKAELILLDNTSRYHKEIPYHTVNSTDYTNAPKNNYGAPVPIAYGDFGQAAAGFGDFENHIVKSRFPAIIVNKEDSSGYINALPDTNKSFVDYGGSTVNNRVLLNQLHSNNVYLGIKNIYLQCSNGNVIVGNASAGSDDTPGTDDENIIKLKGSSFFGYFDFLSATDAGPISNLNELSDKSFTTVENFGCDSNTVTMALRFPTIPKVGTLTTATKADVVLHTTSSSAKSGNFTHFKITDPGSDENLTLTASSAVTQSVPLDATAFDASQRESLDLSSTDLTISISDSGGVSRAVIAQLGLQLEVLVDPHFTRPIYQREVIYTGASNDPGGYKITNTEVDTSLTAQNLDYIYYSGKGREYAASESEAERDEGYGAGDLTENPVFIIEDLLTKELGLTSSEYDTTSFDKSGSPEASGGADIANTFNDAITGIKFAFCIYKFTNSKEIIDAIARQCCSYVFTSGDGKIKIVTLKRTGGYSGADKTVNYNDIKLKSISKTPISAVKNDITINYDFDYQSESFKSSINSTDSTSYGTGTTGINQRLKLKMDAFGIIDTDTATQLADTYKTLFKDQKNVIEFITLTPKYNDLEIGDIILFSNWDSNIKLFGTAMATDYYMITSMNKAPSNSSFKAVKVS